MSEAEGSPGRCELCGERFEGAHACQNPLAKVLGTTIDGRYRVDGVLGRGGMGVVFKAVQTSMQRGVAVKMLNPSLAETPTFFERFKREAELASKLNHPSIITIFDFGRTTDGGCFYVMERLEGESLRNLVKREGPLPIGRAVKIIEQMGRALGHAHAMGVIHRDLKPHNVMVSTVDGADHCKVLDFGLVKMMETEEPSEEAQLTTTGQVLGTPSYMSPEQAAGDPCDQRADLFSLGVCLFYVLSGSPPFKTNSAQKALLFLLSNGVPKVSTMRQGAPIPEALEKFLRRAMAFGADERPSHAEQFIEELHAAVKGLTRAELEERPTGALEAPGTPGLTPSKITSSRAAASSEAGTVSQRDSRRAGRSGQAAAVGPSQVMEGAPGTGATKRKIIMAAGAGAFVLTSAWVLGSFVREKTPPPIQQGEPAHVRTAREGPPPGETPARSRHPAAEADELSASPARPAFVPSPVNRNATVRVESEPAGASVYNGATLLGLTPATLILPREAVNLTLRLEGFQPVTQGVDLGNAAPDEATVVKVALLAVKAAGRAPESPPAPSHKTGPEIPTFGD
jgi:serine/threonine-protein kinase